jgi:hypothetical protein
MVRCLCCRNINSTPQQLLLILILGSLERLNFVQPEWLTGLFHYFCMSNYFWSVIIRALLYICKETPYQLAES